MVSGILRVLGTSLRPWRGTDQDSLSELRHTPACSLPVQRRPLFVAGLRNRAIQERRVEAVCQYGETRGRRSAKVCSPSSGEQKKPPVLRPAVPNWPHQDGQGYVP